MSDQDLDVNSGLVIQQQTDKHQQQQVVHLMLGDGTITSQPQLVQHLVDGSLATQQPDNHQDSIQTSTAQQISQLKLKKPQSPAVSQKELSKQWKILCKKAKEWCSLHGTFTPSFVMMYLDDNKLVWEGPDHMESFISDENVISAFLRTAVTSSVAKDKRQNTAGGYSEDTYMDTAGHQNVSEAESTVVQALEQLGQIPAHASESQSSQYLAPGGSRPAQDNPHDADTDHDDDDGDGDVKMQMNVTSDGQEEGSDVLSEVIDSVIKEWEPGQDTTMESRPRPVQRKRPGIVVDTTVGTFEIVRNKNRKSTAASPSSDGVRVLSISKQSQSPPSAYPPGIYRELVPCPECGKQISRNNLTAHVRIHKGEFRFKCDVCSKGFYNRKDMMVHYRIHTGERPYNCAVCFKAFRQKSKVKEHMLTHSGFKPHVCDHCHHSFARRSDLKCHLRLHTGEKPYQCLDCGKRFSQPGNYRAHMRTHSRETRGQVIGPCDSCGRTYSSLASWKEHLLTHHSSLEHQEATSEVLLQNAEHDSGTLLLQDNEPSSSKEHHDMNVVVEGTSPAQHVLVDGSSPAHHVLVDSEGQQIMVDLSQTGQTGTITLNMDGQVVDGSDEIRTILIDEQNPAVSQAGMAGSNEKWVVLTGEQAAKLMSMTQ